MIIKKPYAFLIKKFRHIHGLLFIMLLFIIIKSFNIYTFFGSYAQNHLYLNQANLASHYIGFLLYFVTVLAIIITLIIYYILSMKNKSNKLYLFLFLYYLILLIYFIYMTSIFNNLEAKALDIESVRALRDISLIAVFPQVIFLFFVVGRTLGFNLKQFDFKKDLEELEISESDNEEVELTLGNDTYKIARSFRKILRLSKYFILENKLFVIGTVSVLIFGISLYFFSKIDIYDEVYNETDSIVAGSLTYNVNESYITNSDLNNIIISKDKYFLLVDIKVVNYNRDKVDLSRETFRLKVNDENLMPSFSYSNKFEDVGLTFSPVELNSGEEKEYLVVFEIDKEALTKEYIFRIKDYSSFKDIVVIPKKLNENKDMGTYTLPNQLKFDDSLLKKSSMVISSVEINEKFKEKIKYTIDGVEQEATYSIIPTSTNKSEQSILKIKASLIMDSESYMKKYIKIPADFFEYYGLLKYRYQGNYKTVKLTKIRVDYDVNNYSYLEIPKEVENANKIDLIISIRGLKYTISLK